MELDGPKAWAFWEMSLKVGLSSLSSCVRWSWSSGERPSTEPEFLEESGRSSGRDLGVGGIQFSYGNDIGGSGAWENPYPTGAMLTFQQEFETLGEAGSLRR